MKEFVISEVKAETAVLVGLITKTQDEAKTKEYLDELEFPCRSLTFSYLVWTSKLVVFKSSLRYPTQTAAPCSLSILSAASDIARS